MYQGFLKNSNGVPVLIRAKETICRFVCDQTAQSSQINGSPGEQFLPVRPHSVSPSDLSKIPSLQRFPTDPLSYNIWKIHFYPKKL